MKILRYTTWIFIRRRWKLCVAVFFIQLLLLIMHEIIRSNLNFMNGPCSCVNISMHERSHHPHSFETDFLNITPSCITKTAASKSQHPVQTVQTKTTKLTTTITTKRKLTTTTKQNLTLSSVELDNLMQSRRVLLAKGCDELKKRHIRDLVYEDLRIVKGPDILYCLVYKSGTTHVKRQLEDLFVRDRVRSNPKPNPHPQRDESKWLLRIVNKNIPEKCTRADAPSLLIVRHPFERLVSAFRDKIERTHPWRGYIERYSKKIVKMFRKKAMTYLGERYFSSLNNYGAPVRVEPPSRRKPTDNLPVFWEFAQYVISGGKSNEHWQPIYTQCPICSLRFNYILKVESLELELRSYFKKFNWVKKLNFANHDNTNQKHGLNSSAVMEIYFRDLTDEDIKKLFKIYEMDFHMFGYTYQRGKLKLP